MSVMGAKGVAKWPETAPIKNESTGFASAIEGGEEVGLGSGTR